jgi:hypothetical protein
MCELSMSFRTYSLSLSMHAVADIAMLPTHAVISIMGI